MSYDYFYGQSGELFSYYRIPKALFQDSRFRQLSTDAKTLYGILLDRMSLSVKNGWLDEQNRVFIIFTIDCTLEITEGTAKVFWISGSDEAVTLIEATGTYSDTITLPEGGNYIGIECENFTGNIELNIE